MGKGAERLNKKSGSYLEAIRGWQVASQGFEVAAQSKGKGTDAADPHVLPRAT